MTDAPEQLSGDVDAWDTPTDLPGWNVHAVAAHTGHLEHLAVTP